MPGCGDPRNCLGPLVTVNQIISLKGREQSIATTHSWPGQNATAPLREALRIRMGRHFPLPSHALPLYSGRV